MSRFFKILKREGGIRTSFSSGKKNESFVMSLPVLLFIAKRSLYGFGFLVLLVEVKLAQYRVSPGM